MALRRVDDNSITQLPAAAFYALMKEGQITVTSSRPNDDDREIMDRLSRASEEDLGQANYRYEIVRRPLDSTTLTASMPRFHRVRLVAGVRCIGRPKRNAGLAILD